MDKNKIVLDIYKDYKFYKIIINNQELTIHTPLEKTHAIKMAVEEWKNEHHPIVMSCEEIEL